MMSLACHKFGTDGSVNLNPAIILTTMPEAGMEEITYGGLMVLCAVISVASNIFATALPPIPDETGYARFVSKYLLSQSRPTLYYPFHISRLTRDTYNITNAGPHPAIVQSAHIAYRRNYHNPNP